MVALDIELVCWQGWVGGPMVLKVVCRLFKKPLGTCSTRAQPFRIGTLSCQLLAFVLSHPWHVELQHSSLDTDLVYTT